jgi:predicted nucleic acid-binding protein
MPSGEKMPDILYDTRFFLAKYTVKEHSLRKKLQAELDIGKPRYTSAITIHEVYRIALETEGREVARIRKAAIQKDFQIIDVDADIASEAAEIKVTQAKDFPLADAIIGATAVLRKLVCFTDDHHIRALNGLKTRWV